MIFSIGFAVSRFWEMLKTDDDKERAAEIEAGPKLPPIDIDTDLKVPAYLMVSDSVIVTDAINGEGLFKDMRMIEKIQIIQDRFQALQKMRAAYVCHECASPCWAVRRKFNKAADAVATPAVAWAFCHHTSHPPVTRSRFA